MARRTARKTGMNNWAQTADIRARSKSVRSLLPNAATLATWRSTIARGASALALVGGGRAVAGMPTLVVIRAFAVRHSPGVIRTRSR